VRGVAGGTLCALALVACGNSSASPGPTVPAKPAAAYLLTLDGLKVPGFVVVEAAHAISTDQLVAGDAALASALKSAGVGEAATARFFRTVPQLSTSNGPIDVRTTVVRCGSAGGAHGAYAALTKHTDAVPSMLAESTGPLGDEGHADEIGSTASDGTPLVEITVTWRTANLVSVLVVRGREGGSGLADALILARAQAAGER
jgi:hypothetical protein